jgi:hypothetical protein
MLSDLCGHKTKQIYDKHVEWMQNWKDIVEEED